MKNSLPDSISTLLKDNKNVHPSLVLAIYSLKYLSIKKKVPKEATLDYLIQNPTDALNNLNTAFKLIEEQFLELRNVYTSLPFSWSQIDIRVLFEILITVYKLENIDYPMTAKKIKNLMLGNRFSSGDHTTPDFLNHLLVKLLDISDNSSFYDGVSGYGGTIIEAMQQNMNKNLKLYGQEIFPSSWAIGKLSLLLSDIPIDSLAIENTLSAPAFIEDDGVRKFDYIAMAIPFSLKLQEDDYIKMIDDPYNRFVLGKIGKSNADMAFIQHALSSSSGKGRVILTVTNGVLFRGGMDQEVRQRLLDTDQIEAVIALPDNLLYNTAIPISLLVLNKNKSQEKIGKVQFINANKLFEKKGTLKQLSIKHINRIYESLTGATNEEYFSKLVPINELYESLSVERYLRNEQINLEGDTTYRINLEKFKNINLNKQTIQSLGTIFRGINATSKNMIEDKQGRFKILKMSDVQEGEILLHKLTEVTFISSLKAHQYQLQEGDVIVSSRGQNIKVAVVPPHTGVILLTQNFLGFRPIKDKFDPYYLQTYLESPIGQYSIKDIMGGSMTPVLNPKDFAALEVVVPELYIQQKVANKYKNAKLNYKKMLNQSLLEFMHQKNNVYKEIGIEETFENIN